MSSDGTKRVVAGTLAAIFVAMAVSPVIMIDAIDVTRDINVGPFVDKVVFKMVGDKLRALQSSEIDLMDGFLNDLENQLPVIDADPDLSTASILRNGYGHITINCRDYPLNISGFRKAFALAFDKTRVTIEIMDGYSQEHDSLVPYANPWCIEDEMPFHYYTARVDLGNALLDSLNFTIDPFTGFRNAPDGSPFDVVIEYSSDSPEIAGGTAQIGVDALLALHVNAETRAAAFGEYISRLANHGDYDMVFYAINFASYDVDRLAYDYWSESENVPYQNPTNFINETYDSWREQLLHGTTYEEVYEASAAIQMILHENVPRLVVYENTYIQAYRNDVFTGHIQDAGRQIAGPWTLRKIHKIDGAQGGTVKVGLGNPDSFNIFTTSLGHSNAILANVWAKLYDYDPNLNPWPCLAESILVETHSDNPAVYEGNTRFTIKVIKNATWTDGTPLTAEDVAFTFTYLFESGEYGNPKSVGLGEMVAAYAPTPYIAVIEFGTESWWHFSNFAYRKIIPKHIFNDIDGIGYEGWNTWNPVFDPSEPYVTSGPFTLTDFQPGEFVEISANPKFCYYPDFSEETISTTTPSTIPTTPGSNLTLAVVAGTIGAASTILVGGFILLRGKTESL